ncbi:hypothetical protein BO71DRAFT_214136 [Aspergillus ellipticus CBS 707.79]|uniref:Uncharacterized protein n=1 Tax=Aspergillus ellipticus CBS 707.79 TaxID=1448320 RepID=A0A319DUJ4_9EURO|nr:hypothetical protein BO71DRAFT_214136 [Aspergillus ellipticus CBS 707.79]
MQWIGTTCPGLFHSCSACSVLHSWFKNQGFPRERRLLSLAYLPTYLSTVVVHETHGWKSDYLGTGANRVPAEQEDMSGSTAGSSRCYGVLVHALWAPLYTSAHGQNHAGECISTTSAASTKASTWYIHSRLRPGCWCCESYHRRQWIHVSPT